MKNRTMGNSLNPTKLFRFFRSFKTEIRLTYYLMLDKRVAFYLKIPVFLALMYLIFPIDLIPDFFLFGLGYVDDLMLLYWAIQFFLRSAPDSLKQEYLRKF